MRARLSDAIELVGLALVVWGLREAFGWSAGLVAAGVVCVLVGLAGAKEG